MRLPAAFVGLPVVLGLLAALAAPLAAFANGAVSVALNHPAMMARAANSGLFTSIARPGDHLVAVGELGRIVVSDDNGQSWHQVPTPTRVTLTAVRFATPNEGWAVGQMGLVLHTTDGGSTWLKQLDGLRANQLLLAAAQADMTAQGSNATTTANLQAAQQFVGGGPTVPFLAISALSRESVTLAGGYGMAFVSTDGGANWHSIFDEIPNPNGLHIYSLVPDKNVTFVVGEQGMLLRYEGGQYTALSTPFQGTFFGGLITPAESVIIYGLQGTVLRSTDQGKSWSQPQSGSDVGIDCGLVLQDGRILLGDVGGHLLLSHDDGKSFVTIDEPEPVVALAQAPDKSIIIGGPQGLYRLPLATLNTGN